MYPRLRKFPKIKSDLNYIEDWILDCLEIVEIDEDKHDAGYIENDNKTLSNE